MLLMSFRLNKKLISVMCVLVCATIAVIAVSSRFYSGRAEVPVSMNRSGAVTKNVTVQDNAQRLAFIRQFGWEVEQEPCEVEDVLIPREFDEVYAKYNGIQKAQGLDLARYAGKQVKRYSYRVTNYPGARDEIRFNLLSAESKVIGGDVCSLSMDGFMHGFQYEGADKTSVPSEIVPSSTQEASGVQPSSKP